jgi:hypothetical protein
MDFDRTDFEGMDFEGGELLAVNLEMCRPTDGFSNGVEGPVGPIWSDLTMASG